MDLDFFLCSNSLIFGIAAILLVICSTRVLNLPPGPYGLPVLGYLPFLGKEGYITLSQLCKRYGNIISLYMGRQLVVILGNIDVVRELLSNEPFLARPRRPPNNLLPETKTFTASSGNEWTEQRRFAMHSLRDLGFGKTALEKNIMDEIEYFLREMKKHNGEPCDVRRYLQSSISNNTTVLVFGRRMVYDDPERLFLDDHVRILVKFFRPTSVHAFFPWIRPSLSFFRIWNYHVVSKIAKELDIYLKKQITEHKKTLDKNNVRDYLDSFLLKMEEEIAKKGETSFTMDMLKGNCLSLIAAGVDPVLATAEWLIVTMAIYQDIQEKVQKEIDSVIGRSKLPQWSDHPNLPYSMAALMELQRWKTVIPLSMLRCTSKDVNYTKYRIPKGTFVTANLWSIHTDEKHWPQPYEYRPERFIDDNGKLINKPDSFIPFSFGRRGCPGETLGKLQVFLYFTNVLHRFHVCLPEGVTVNDIVSEIGVAQQIKEYKLCLLPRD